MAIENRSWRTAEFMVTKVPIIFWLGFWALSQAVFGNEEVGSESHRNYKVEVCDPEESTSISYWKGLVNDERKLPRLRELKRRMKRIHQLSKRAYRQLSSDERSKISVHFKEEEKILELEKTFRDLDPESLTRLKEEIRQKIQKVRVEDLLVAEAENLITELFPADIKSIELAINVTPEDMQNFAIEKYSPEAIEELRFLPVIKLDSLSSRRGSRMLSLNGRFFDVDSHGSSTMSFSYPIKVSIAGEKIDIPISYDIDHVVPYFKNILVALLGFDRLITLLDEKPREHPVQQLASLFSVGEEFFHAMDHANRLVSVQGDEIAREAEFLKNLVEQMGDQWIKEDLDWLKDRPEYKKYIQSMSSEDSEARALERLSDTYRSEYRGYWTYLVSEVELRGKWRTVQYLKHKRKMKFEDLILNEIWSLNHDAESTPGYPFIYMSPKVYFYWKALYDSDSEAPISQDPYLTARKLK